MGINLYVLDLRLVDLQLLVVRAALWPACLGRRANVQSHLGTRRAAVSSMVIVPDKVSVGAGSVARSAGSRRASAIVGSNSEADLGELRAGAHVDERKIPEDSVALQGVLVLKDIDLLRLHGHLDGDAAAVGVGAPALSVAGTGLEGLHGAVILADGPVVDGVLHVVVDVDASTVSVGVGCAVGGSGVGGAVHSSRSSRGKSANGSKKTESLGEIHVGLRCCLKESLKECNGGRLKRSCKECLFLISLLPGWREIL